MQPNEYWTDRQVPQAAYVGFGYNPDLATRGERLDMFSFFSWMRQLQQTENIEWIIWNASGYYIVNRTARKSIEKLGPNPSAGEILETLIAEQERPKRREIAENCDLRATYLERIADLAGVRVRCVDSREIFRNDPRFAVALAQALDSTERLGRVFPSLVNRITPQTENPASALYLPLEIAEALYLQEVEGVDGKFGPITEEGFDAAILQTQNELQRPYLTFRCPIGPRRPGYLSDQNVFWSRSSPMQRDAAYLNFVRSYSEKFSMQGECEEDTISRLQAGLENKGKST